MASRKARGGGMAWHNEALRVDCRSPKFEPLIERDLTIIETSEER